MASVCDTVAFRKPRKRPAAGRRQCIEGEEEPSASDGQQGDEAASDDQQLSTRLEAVRDLQKLRSKPHGLSTAELALGEEAPPTATFLGDDPLNMKIGGLTDLKSARRAVLRDADLEDEIRQQFSKETSLRDEDEEMRKFVDGELNKAKQSAKSPTKVAVEAREEEEDAPKKKMRTSDDLFREAAEKVKHFSAAKGEEMLSNQMLSGIPEVDLGIDAKIRNIESTEAEKLRLLRDTMKKDADIKRSTQFKDELMRQLAPKYVQHERFAIGKITDISSASAAAEDSRQRRSQWNANLAEDDDKLVGSTPEWHDQGKYTPQASGDTPFWSIANGDQTPGLLQPANLHYMAHL